MIDSNHAANRSHCSWGHGVSRAQPRECAGGAFSAGRPITRGRNGEKRATGTPDESESDIENDSFSYTSNDFSVYHPSPNVPDECYYTTIVLSQSQQRTTDKVADTTSARGSSTGSTINVTVNVPLSGGDTYGSTNSDKWSLLVVGEAGEEDDTSSTFDADVSDDNRPPSTEPPYTIYQCQGEAPFSSPTIMSSRPEVPDLGEGLFGSDDAVMAGGIARQAAFATPSGPSLGGPSGLFAYGYDSAGRLTSLADARGGLTSFTYDPAGNLSSLTDPAGNTTHWSYDSKGGSAVKRINWATRSRSPTTTPAT